MVRTSLRKITVGLLALSIGWAGSVWSAPAETPKTQVVVLQPTQGPGLRIDFDYNSRSAAPPAFENEPIPKGKLTARGLIPTIPPTPILRNITDGLLYLKVDHDTNFSEGSLVTYKSRYDRHVVFENLVVSTERDALEIPYTVNLYTYETGCAGWLEVQSGWSGEFELEGETCAICVVDNLDGRIDGSDLMSLSSRKWTRGMLIRDCPVPQTLCLGGHTLRLDFAFQSMPAGVVLEATISELQPTLGQLSIQANGCLHLRLRDDRQIALLSFPGGTVSLPVGNYRVDNCILYDEAHKRLSPRFAGWDQAVSILPGQTTPLCVGAPLSNSVEVSRDRNLLHLKHRLTGAGGEQYECYDPQDSPSFAIYKGPLKIAGGTFPFG